MNENNYLVDLINDSEHYTSRDMGRVVGHSILTNLKSFYPSRLIGGGMILKSNSDLDDISDNYYIWEKNIKSLKIGKWHITDFTLKKDIAQIVCVYNKPFKKDIIITFCDKRYESILDNLFKDIEALPKNKIILNLARSYTYLD